MDLTLKLNLIKNMTLIYKHNIMKVRTLEHKRKVKVWITFIFVFTTWIGFGWWLDAQDYPAVEKAANWLEGVHFLPSLAIIMVYLSVVVVVVHYYWKLIALIVGRLINKYY